MAFVEAEMLVQGLRCALRRTATVSDGGGGEAKVRAVAAAARGGRAGGGGERLGRQGGGRVRTRQRSGQGQRRGRRRRRRKGRCQSRDRVWGQELMRQWVKWGLGVGKAAETGLGTGRLSMAQQ